MATTPEAKTKAKVVTLLKKYGVYYFYPVTGGYGMSGVFDIVCCFGGAFIGIEVKADCKKKPTGLQSKNALLAHQAGAHVLLIHDTNLDVLENLLKEVTNERKDRPNGTCVWSFDGVETGKLRV